MINIHSCTKSIISALVGIATQEGYIQSNVTLFRCLCLVRYKEPINPIIQWKNLNL